MSGGLVFDPLCAWCGGGGRVRAPWPNIGLSCHCGKRPKDTPKAPEPAAAPPVDTEDARRQLDDVRAMSTIKRSTAIALLGELDAHCARHTELMALVAEWRAYACDGNTCPDSARSTTYCADALARVIEATA